MKKLPLLPDRADFATRRKPLAGRAAPVLSDHHEVRNRSTLRCQNLSGLSLI
jgi:hypothetical protein